MLSDINFRLKWFYTSGGSGSLKTEKPTEISKTRTEPKIQIFEKPNRTETEITNRGYPIGNLIAFWKAYPPNILNKQQICDNSSF